MKRKNYLIYIIVAILVMFFAWFLYTLQQNTVIPRSIKLTECTNSVLEFSFRVPKGRSYYFVLATPGVGMTLKPPFHFSGHIQISDETTNIDFLINSDFSQQCNWLETEGIPWSFALTGDWNTNCLSLSQLIQPQKNYNIKIIFNEPPPSSTSIWLHWLQAAKDKGR